VRRILVSAVLVAGLVAVPLPGVARGNGGHCDFNGDGYDDAAIGASAEDVAGRTSAGAVNVIYGSADKLSSVGNQFWTLDGAELDGGGPPFFGRSVECGDFNDDGFDDAVFGADGMDIAGVSDVGVVHVLFGSVSGLTADDSLLLHRDAPGVAGKGEPSLHFGESLAVGDFDGDGHDDLAVGAPFDSIGEWSYAGSVSVFYGFSGGLSISNDKVWHRGRKGVHGALQAYANFGHSLAAGDFDGDGHDDLAIGVPYDNIVGEAADAGSVSVLYGSSAGLTATGHVRLHRNKKGIKDVANRRDEFGHSVVAGDFDGDGRDDLAIGAPRDDIGGTRQAGSVHVIKGSINGLTPAGDQIWYRDTPDVRNTAAYLDQFGYSLTTGRFDTGDKDDLAVGVLLDDPDGVFNAGSVHVFYGSNDGLTAVGDQIWHQGRKGIKGANEISDWFGVSVSAGDFDGNGEDDLLVGVPHDDGSATTRSGKVAVIYGNNGGLAASGDQTWSQGSPGILGVIEDYESFGWGVSGA